MPKQKPAKTSKETIFHNKSTQILLIILMILIALFVSKTWIKDHFSPKVKRIYYGYQARSAFSDELKTLNALSVFGFKNIKSEPSRCTYQNIYGYNSLQLQCTSTHQSYVVIKADQKSEFISAAHILDQQLKNDRWTETMNATPNIGDWFQAIASGKDWYPDEGAYKNFDNKHCALDFFIAYANPQPPAFALDVSCSSPVLTKIEDLPS